MVNCDEILDELKKDMEEFEQRGGYIHGIPSSYFNEYGDVVDPIIQPVDIEDEPESMRRAAEEYFKSILIK